MDNFDLQKTDGSARAGVLKTRRGDIETPFFFSVATQGVIKGALSVDDLQKMQAPFVLANTYHLHLRPGSELVKKLGGLHEFMKWNGPIITDSGGFQVFSIKRKKITDDGVFFNSHIDGQRFYLDAEKSIEIQNNLGADILMAFDECPPNVPKFHKIRRAVERTTDWAKRSLKKHNDLWPVGTHCNASRPQIFGIIQGGCFPELRQRSLEEITALPFDGFALGGLAVGETAEEMYKVLDEMCPQMPENKPRYLMGVGNPTNLLEAISRGIDMFDCVIPMRNARHGTVFTQNGDIKIKNAKFREDKKVLDEGCKCETCAEKQYSRAYLHHLLRAEEMAAARFLTIHNLHFFHNLMRQVRKKILEGNFEEWKEKMVKKWNIYIIQTYLYLGTSQCFISNIF